MSELKIEAKVENLKQVLSFVDGFLERLNCPLRTQMRLDVVVEELFVNIASYAYAFGTGDATIRVETTDDPPVFSVTFIDSGVPYDPLKKTDPDVSLSAEDREIGGLGIFLVKKIMDGVEYKRDGQKNVLTVVKKLG